MLAVTALRCCSRSSVIFRPPWCHSTTTTALVARASSTLKEKATNFQLKNAIEEKKKVWQEKKEDLKELKEKLRDDIKENIKEKKEKVKEVRVKVESIIERENVFTIPNLLCLGRIGMSPYLGYVIVQGDYGLGMGILTVAAITDLLDGWIARSWPGQASRFGSFLDPMSDKILIGCLVVSLTYSGLFPIWLTGMVVGRDALLIASGFVIRYRSLPPPRTFSRYFDVTHATAQLAPTFTSKVNTAVQLVAVAASLGAPVWGYVDHPYLQSLWYFTGLTTVAAALSYILFAKDTYKILSSNKGKN